MSEQFEELLNSQLNPLDAIYEFVRGDKQMTLDQLDAFGRIVASHALDDPRKYLELAIILPRWKPFIVRELVRRVDLETMINFLSDIVTLLVVRRLSKNESLDTQLVQELEQVASVLYEVGGAEEAYASLPTIGFSQKSERFYKLLLPHEIDLFLVDPLLQESLFTIDVDNLVLTLLDKGDTKWLYLIQKAIPFVTQQTLQRMSKVFPI